MEEQAIRVCERVNDAIEVAVGSQVRSCSRCRQPVFMDVTQLVPPGLENASLVCIPCGLEDDELAPGIRMWIEVAEAAA